MGFMNVFTEPFRMNFIQLPSMRIFTEALKNKKSLLLEIRILEYNWQLFLIPNCHMKLWLLNFSRSLDLSNRNRLIADDYIF